jgi:copper chaperone CopZ
MSHQKIKLDIKGMHCRSCEILLERNIGRIEGVKKVRTNYKKGTGEIEYDRELDWPAIERAVNAAGYSLGKEDKKHFFSRNVMDYMELAASGMILLVIYLLLKEFGIFNLNVNTSTTPGLLGVLIVGLTKMPKRSTKKRLRIIRRLPISRLHLHASRPLKIK